MNEWLPNLFLSFGLWVYTHSFSKSKTKSDRHNTLWFPLAFWHAPFNFLVGRSYTHSHQQRALQRAQLCLVLEVQKNNRFLIMIVVPHILTRLEPRPRVLTPVAHLWDWAWSHPVGMSLASLPLLQRRIKRLFHFCNDFTILWVLPLGSQYEYL